MDNQYNTTKNECKAKRKSKTNTSKPTNHQQQSNSLENYKTTHNPGISRHQPSVVCWTSWPAQPGQDGREFRQPGGVQKTARIDDTCHQKARIDHTFRKACFGSQGGLKIMIFMIFRIFIKMLSQVGHRPGNRKFARGI